MVGVVLGSLIVSLSTEWQRRRQGAAAEKKDREAAYIALLVSSMAFVNRAQALNSAKRFRSGFVEWRDVTLGRRKPADPLELYEFFSRDGDKLNEAWARVWAIGSQEAIDAADRVVSACAALLDSAVAIDPKRTWLTTLTIGERWTADQERACDEAPRRVAEQRVAFATVIRQDANRKAVQFALERNRSG